ncbi:MAG: 50S ribosomal protein L21 [Patescibacteria group bacterium]
MFAIIQTGGKQYKVEEGQTLSIEHIPGKKEGDVVSFDKVLLVDDGKKTTVGKPHVSGAKVEATIAQAGRARKVVVIKYKAKSRYFKKRGHRQPFLKVKINSIK